MAEIPVAIVAKLAEYLIEPLVRQGQYLFCPRNTTKTLETEKQKLVSTLDGIQTRVQEAQNKTEKIVDVVDKWLCEAKIHMDELQKLEQQMNENNSCFQGRCPTWKRYRLCRQMTKLIESTKNLNQRSEFNRFSTTAPLPGIEYFSSANFVYFQSTKLASDQLLEALQDNSIHMIGLYGMGGSGKTTLVIEVGKRAKELQLFDHVIFTTVSQNPDIGKMQNEIADLLGLRFEEQSEAGRVRRLSMRLSSGERILMILDDVWAMINLKDVGIPLRDYGCCKILLTTRRQQVCNLMDCERKIPLLLLSDDESHMLFRKHARNIDESLDIVAQEIIRECKGLPIAIQAVGASLTGKSIEEWKEALRRLRDSKPIDVEEGVRDAFSCLRLSYDCLRSKEAKSLFLMCSLYPEDAYIFVEDLFKITIGLGMCEELGSFEDARNKVRACINHLVDSCLLTHSENKKDHLRMHDIVRDVALWISSQENHTIVVNREKDLKVATDESIRDCYALTSWCNQTSQFSQQLDAPKLEILLLTNIGACELSEANFEGMRALKVLQIDSSPNYRPVFHFSSLSHPINSLTNLRMLRLQGWQLGDDLSWVLVLKRLEVLDLKGSSFKNLPQGLEELGKLKLLHLSSIKEQSLVVIERCTQLQELHASSIRLSRTILKLDKCFSNDATFPRLKRYKLEIGNFDISNLFYAKDSVDFFCKALCLGGFKISTLSPFMKYLLQQAKAVYLDKFNGGCKNVALDIVQVVGGMNELTSLWLHSCSELECLADATSQHIDLFLPKLIKLKLEYLANLKEIWRGPPFLCFFKKLQELYISNCPMLTSLFPKSVARVVLFLQKLTIKDCSELKNIIEEDGDGAYNEIISASDTAYLVFSKLKSLDIIDCDKLQYVFSNSFVQGLQQLEEVRIDRASQLKYAFGQHMHQEVQVKLPVLSSLKLTGLKNLLSIFPENFYSSCPCLKELHWIDCPKFNALHVNAIASSNTNTFQDSQVHCKTSTPLTFLNLEKLKIESCSVENILLVFEKEVFAQRNSLNQIMPSLSILELENLLELKMVWSGPTGTVSLQNLTKFTVSGCNNLRTIFSPVILKSMPLLEYVGISNCNELEEIMSGTEAGQQHQGQQNAQSPQLCFPNLQSLEVRSCNKLKCLFSSNHSETILPNLRSLILEEVPSLKDFCQGLSLSSDRLPQLWGSKLEILRLGSVSEVWLIWTTPSHILNLAHLQTLRLIGCNELEYVFGEDFLPSALPKLVNLEVRRCNKLKCLMSTSSTTLLLSRLYSIWILECEELEVLFRHNSSEASSSSDTVNKIVLPNLFQIVLQELPSLVDIFKGFNLSAMDICSIQIKKCSKLSSIMGATGSMVIELETKEALAEIHANNNGNQLPYLYPDYLVLKELELSELSFVCTAFTCFQNLSFRYLHQLIVVRCGKVKCILPTSVWGSLPNLRFLKIRECEQVEEIIMQESQQVTSSNDDMHYYDQPPFPELKIIKVKGCHKLKCLFRTTTATTPVGKLFPKLNRIKVSEAAKMEEIFSNHNTSDHEEALNILQHIELPNLTTLELSKLPALTHFCKGPNFNSPKLKQVQINECPNFDSSSFFQPTDGKEDDDDDDDDDE